MEDAAQGEAEVKDDAAEESGSDGQVDGKPSLPRRKPNRDVAVRVSVAAFLNHDRATLAVVRDALDKAGFAEVAGLKRYLGGTTERHALVWLALRTQAFTVVE